MAKLLETAKIKDIMTTKVVAALESDSVIDAAKLMVQKDYSGIPVVDHGGKFKGMITMRELLNKEGLYLPTAVEFFKSLRLAHSDDAPEISERLQAFQKLRTKDIMNRKPLTLSPAAGLEKAVEAFLLRHEDIFAVVNEKHELLGVVSRFDILRTITDPIQQIPLQQEMTMKTEPELISDIGNKFVILSRTRMRFWYLAFLVFLLIGFVISIALIIRINLV